MINGSDLVNQPWNTTFSPYISLFGQGWMLIPLSFIAAALFLKTRDPILVSGYMILVGALFTAGGVFTGFTGMVLAYAMFTAIGIAVLMYGVFYGGR